jgi:possible glycosyltransferase protein
MRLLVIGDISVIFTYEYVTEIASKFPDCKVDILSFAPRKEANTEREEKLIALGCNIFYQPQYKLFKLHKLLHILIRFAETVRYRICKKYDVINIHFPGIDSWAVCRYAPEKTRVITSLYGSDVLRAGKRSLDMIKKLLVRSDAVTVASSYIKEKVSKKFNAQFDDKTEIVRYGSNAAACMSDAIAKYTKAECKKHFGFPKERITVLCGYNGSRAQRHMEILNELKKLPKAVQEKIFLIFQCSYGFDEIYKKELSAVLAESHLAGVIITDFMQGEILAKFRNSIDIFLNLQPTDVLSATMIEELESRAIVVKGDWLCYPDLEERNIYMRSISDMKKLSSEMEDIVANYSEELKKVEANKGIWEILSWEKQYDKWEKIICDIK